ncbi:hypothetical protein D3C77_666250 [compost metagenome]
MPSAGLQKRSANSAMSLSSCGVSLFAISKVLITANWRIDLKTEVKKVNFSELFSMALANSS